MTRSGWTASPTARATAQAFGSGALRVGSSGIVDVNLLRRAAPGTSSPLKESLCRRGRVIVDEDKARDRVESSDSARERNAVIRPQGPDVARMDFFNGLLD